MRTPVFAVGWALEPTGVEMGMTSLDPEASSQPMSVMPGHLRTTHVTHDSHTLYDSIGVNVGMQILPDRKQLLGAAGLAKEASMGTAFFWG